MVASHVSFVRETYYQKTCNAIHLSLGTLTMAAEEKYK